MNPSGCRGKQAEKEVIMKSGNGRKEVIIITLLGCIPVIWLALLVVPFAEDGLAEALINSDKILKDPFDIRGQPEDSCSFSCRIYHEYLYLSYKQT